MIILKRSIYIKILDLMNFCLGNRKSIRAMRMSIIYT